MLTPVVGEHPVDILLGEAAIARANSGPGTRARTCGGTRASAGTYARTRASPGPGTRATAVTSARAHAALTLERSQHRTRQIEISHRTVPTPTTEVKAQASWSARRLGYHGLRMGRRVGPAMEAGTRRATKLVTT
jgi:hypothetical protein